MATVLFALGLMFMRSRIALAIRVIKAAASALESVPRIVLLPYLCTLRAAAYLVFWCFGALHIYSVAQYTEYELPSELRGPLDSDTFIVDEFDESMRKYLLWHVFGLFWAFQFIVYLCYMVMAHVFSEWYFARADDTSKSKVRGEERNEFSAHPVSRALGRVCRYHLGTIAFGAFIVAVVKFVNAVFTYLQGKCAKRMVLI